MAHDRWTPDWLAYELDLDELDKDASRAAVDESWRTEAASPDEVRALVAQLRRARQEVQAVKDLADGWIGFDSSHHYGEAVYHALGSVDRPKRQV
jgi:hypothetical protein